MAYQQTTATGVADLIDKLAAFAATLGWTINRNTVASGNRTVSISRAGSDFLHIFNTDTTNVRLRASTGINTGVAVASQPGVSAAEAVSNCGAGPFASVFLFGDNTPAPYIHVAFDTGNAIFRHISLGMVEKIGTWTGGTYFDATNIEASTSTNANTSTGVHHLLFDNGDGSNISEGAVRLDFGASTNVFAPMTGQSLSGALAGLPYRVFGGSRDVRSNEGFYLSSVNSWSGVTPLRQVKLRVERGSGFLSDIGYIPGFRLVNIARWATGDEFSIGPDTWKVFPWWRQGFRPSGDTTGAYSGNYGFAYLKTI